MGFRLPEACKCELFPELSRKEAMRSKRGYCVFRIKGFRMKTAFLSYLITYEFHTSGKTCRSHSIGHRDKICRQENIKGR